MNYESLLELVKKRRSIRCFKPDPVPDEYIEKIIDAARWAPSGFNMQPWEFAVVKKPKLKEEIVKLIGEGFLQFKEMETTREPWQGALWKLNIMNKKGMDFTKAPVYIILLGDPRTNAGLPMGIRFDPNLCQSVYRDSLASAFLYMHLAATTLGLASQWVSAIKLPFVHCMVKDLLGIPNSMEIHDMMALGYPAIRPSRKFLRNTEKMVHYDKCDKDDFRTDEEVRDFVKRSRSWTIGVLSRSPD
ncbi:Nitroreductase [uncultured Desulfobacterium sp.]|uniref:Nitroreductase n=1 Tax=uncultured Desulfobacterium sp. TaxID=201089 RepID=A0A445MZ57_9BACT|nr:Nitroreductase [uncultured Desulfobacterium sp.]